MKKLLITIMLFTASNICFSQSYVVSAIKKSIVVNQKLFHSKEFEKKSFLFSLTLSINANGNVDSVFYSKSELYSTKLININKIIQKLKNDENTFKEYKNETLFIGINLIRFDDTEIKATSNIKEIYTSIIESEGRLKKNKKIIYLESLLIVI